MQQIYMAGWVTACLVAAVLFAVRRSAQVILRASYWRLLLQPWKVALIAVRVLLSS